MRLLSREDILTQEPTEGATRLRRFVFRVKENKPQRRQDMTVLAEAFERILRGEDPKKSLGISKPGRKFKTAAQAARDEIPAVFEVEQLVDHGIKVGRALEMAAEKFHISVDALKKYRQAHGTTVRFVLSLKG